MRAPDTGRGQVQKWFYVRLVDTAATIDFSRVDERKGTREFSAYGRMSFAELLVALRWLARFCVELREVTLAQVQRAAWAFEDPTDEPGALETLQRLCAR
jgi:hypothetical protein